jgi:hypothetical protein
LQIIVIKSYKITSHIFRVLQNYIKKNENIEHKHTKLNFTTLRFHKVTPLKNETLAPINLKLQKKEQYRNGFQNSKPYKINLHKKNHFKINHIKLEFTFANSYNIIIWNIVTQKVQK